ncbi:LysR family substrate-binding domain-containing protein [Kitasatospora sp. NPDC056181]|uniref:LysR family substrate-binding domain-containing protein n=1 Tax=Kitasatospora sp. NPDC056181 TaxID=3345737 RepID=UPI0035D942AC
MTEMQANPSFRLVYVPGVTPGKWVRVWEQRLPDVPLTLLAVPVEDGEPTLLGGGADAGLVRLPVDRGSLSAIPLYTETTVVVFPKDHWLAAAEEVPVADLADEVVFHPVDDSLGWQELPGRPAIERPATTADAIELVAANVGVLLVPQSLARLHHRRDLTYRPVPDAPQSQVALSWPEDRTTDLVEEFIGIVRGRTVNSSRGRAGTAQSEEKPVAPGARPRGGGAGKAAAGKSGGGRTAGGKASGGRTAGGKPSGGKSGGGRPGTGKASGGKSGGARRGRPGR